MRQPAEELNERMALLQFFSSFVVAKRNFNTKHNSPQKWRLADYGNYGIHIGKWMNRMNVDS